ITVISAMLGVPRADHDRFQEWSHALTASNEPPDRLTPEIVERGSEAALAVEAYFRSLIEDKRPGPQDDLLSALIAAEEQGHRLSTAELISMCILLLIAGHETTVNLIANGTLALLRHPDRLALLRANPVLMPGAVEEFLRYDSSVQVV